MKMTTSIVPVEIRLVALLHRRSMVEGMAGTTVACVMSSATEMHAAGLKTGAEIESMMSRSSAMKGTMTIMAPTMTNLTSSVLQKGGIFQDVSRFIPET
jgi:predicted ABC-type sugar transport system permease subunit